jgi:hypothetical protein
MVIGPSTRNGSASITSGGNDVDGADRRRSSSVTPQTASPEEVAMKVRQFQELWGLLIVGGVLCSSVAAHAKLAKVAGPEVSFTLVGPAGMKIVGNGNELRVLDDGATVKVSVPLAGMKTGISIRDKHMHEKYLETANFPSTELQVPRSALKIPAAGPVTQDTAGTLLLHGKSKTVTFHYNCTRSGAKLNVQGTMHLNMNDFGIQVPSYLGVTVKPEVDVAAQFEVTDE